ncbi:MAG: nucleoside-diphosphate kinase [bacterium]
MDILIKETGHRNERTLVMVKPDGVQRGLTGEVIKRFENVGLKLVALKLIVPTKEMVGKHYTTDPDWIVKTGTKNIKSFVDKGMEPPISDPQKAGEAILDTLVAYITSGPVVAMIWQGANAVKIVRKLTGGTEPLTSDVGTIRGDFVLDSYEMADAQNRSVRNVIHASGTIDEAQSEIAQWFKSNEIVEYEAIHEQILYRDFSHLSEN